MATVSKTRTTSGLVTGSDVVVQSLVNHGVEIIFAYPGGASMPLHQALTRFKDQIRTILPRHEQGGGFAAQGLARTTGKPGVCMATSGPGALNLVTAIADAKMDSIPLVAITGQVGTHVIGTDAFQETPIVEVCRGITKHHYLVTDVNDVARVMREAFHIATTGRPGPVLVDLPKNVQTAHDRTRLQRADELARLSRRNTRQAQARTNRAGGRGHQARQAADYLRRRRRDWRRSQRRAARVGAEDKNSGDDDRDGPGRISGERSAVARHARHARHRVFQLRRERGRFAAGVRRAVRRPRDGQGCENSPSTASSCTSTSIRRKSTRTKRPTFRSSAT